jgi:alkanesulfonate monooxygenase
LAEGESSESAWVTPYLWVGAVPYLGPTAMSLVGAPDDIADGLFEFRRAGISQFIFQGRPDLETMIAFGRDVLPIVRAREAQETSAAGAASGSSAAGAASAAREERQT